MRFASAKERDRAARILQRNLRPVTILNMELPSLGQPLEFHEMLVRAIAAELGIPSSSVEVTISQRPYAIKAAKTIQRAWRTFVARGWATVPAFSTLQEWREWYAAELLQATWRGHSWRRRTAAALDIQYFWRVHRYTPDEWHEWWAAEVLQDAWRQYSWRHMVALRWVVVGQFRMLGVSTTAFQCTCSCGRAAMGR